MHRAATTGATASDPQTSASRSRHACGSGPGAYLACGEPGASEFFSISRTGTARGSGFTGMGAAAGGTAGTGGAVMVEPTGGGWPGEPTAAATTARANSVMVANRLAGFLSSALWSTGTNAAGTFERSGVSSCCFMSTSPGVSPSNGGCPVSIS